MIFRYSAAKNEIPQKNTIFPRVHAPLSGVVSGRGSTPVRLCYGFLSVFSKPRRELVGFRFPALGETSGGMVMWRHRETGWRHCDASHLRIGGHSGAIYFRGNQLGF